MGVRIQVKVTPRAKRPGVERSEGGTWRVRVAAPAEDGRANAELIEAIARELDVPKSRVRIVRGAAGRLKQVEVG